MSCRMSRAGRSPRLKDSCRRRPRENCLRRARRAAPAALRTARLARSTGSAHGTNWPVFSGKTSRFLRRQPRAALRVPERFRHLRHRPSPELPATGRRKGHCRTAWVELQAPAAGFQFAVNSVFPPKREIRRRRHCAGPTPPLPSARRPRGPPVVPGRDRVGRRPTPRTEQQIQEAGQMPHAGHGSRLRGEPREHAASGGPSGAGRRARHLPPPPLVSGHGA